MLTLGLSFYPSLEQSLAERGVTGDIQDGSDAGGRKLTLPRGQNQKCMCVSSNYSRQWMEHSMNSF